MCIHLNDSYINVHSGSDRANDDILVCIAYNIVMLCHKVFAKKDYVPEYSCLFIVSTGDECFHYF